MKLTLRYLSSVACAIIVAGNLALSQDDLLKQLQKSSADAVPKYLSPILSGWAADLNTAFYHSADLHDILGFDVGVKVALATVTDEDKTYLFNMPATIPNPINPGQPLVAGTDYPATKSLPTVLGAKGNDYTIGGLPYKNVVRIQNTSTAKTGGQTLDLYILPGGYDIPAVPFPVGQLNVGLPFGLEVMARFIPPYSLGDYGKINLVGFGVRYDIDQFIPLFPIDLAAHFMTQKFGMKSQDDKDILSASAMSYGLELSKKLLILTVYGGFDLQSSSFTVNAIDGSSQTPAGPVKFHVNEYTVDGKNSSRAVVGLRLLLLFINVHAEYSFAKVPILAAGVGISFR